MGNGRERHRQVFVKVNAEVDIGIADLISALNLFPGLMTYSSCAGKLGSDGTDGRAAHIEFYYGNNWAETSHFVFEFLAPGLFELLGSYARIKLEWGGGNGTPTTPHRVSATLELRPSQISNAVRAIKALHGRFQKRRFISRRSLLACGNAHRESRS